MVGHTTITALGLKKRSKSNRRPFWLCGFEEEAGWLPVGYAFLNLFADFIQRSYADDVWVPSNPGPDLVQDDPPFCHC
jgi:hypothetical protein